MLEGLDDIDWHRLSHAYGEASDVPNLIRDVVSPDQEQRDSALQQLFATIWHQGTVYEATVHALPFLIDLLGVQDDQVPDAELLPLLVASILCGCGYAEVHCAQARINPFTRRPIPPPPDLDQRLAQERRVVAEVRRVGTRAVPLLVPYVKHPNADLRVAIADAFSRYPALSSLTAPCLRDALAVESDETTREAMAAALAALATGPA